MSFKTLLVFVITTAVLSSLLVIGSGRFDDDTPENKSFPDTVAKNEIKKTNLNQPIALKPPPHVHALTSIIKVGPGNDNNLQWRGLKKNALRSVPINLDPSLISRNTFFEGDEIALQLFDDVYVQSSVTKSIENVNGTISTTAKIIDSKYGRVFIAQTNGEVRAKITLPEQNRMYAIHYNRDDGNHYAVELNPALEEPADVGTHRYAPVTEIEQQGTSKKKAEENVASNVEYLPEGAASESEPSAVVDVLVVYTNLAFAEVGSLENVQNLIAIGMSMANDAHDNTKTGITINLVHSAQLDYTENLAVHNQNDFLDFITHYSGHRNDPDGIMDEVHAIRNTYGADFVSLMVGNGSSTGGSGLGWILTNLSGNPDYAFSVVDESIYDGYNAVHEIGHNMGLDHAADQINSSAGPTGFSIGTDAAGWHWHQDAGKKGYSSVMAYSNGFYYADGLDHFRVGLFSDPNIIHETMKAGDETLANNARVLRLLKGVYAGYRSRDLGDVDFLVESPNKAVVLTAGEPYIITWNSQNIAGNVKIELYRNNLLQQVVASNTLNDRRYTWNIPADLSGNSLKIRISSVADSTRYDESDNAFEIHTVFFNEPLNSGPVNIILAGDWEFGPWTDDQALWGGPDSSNTGENIFSTNLDYVAFDTSTLTMGPLNCNDYQEVRLHFSGWYALTEVYTAKVEYKNGEAGTWHDLYSQKGQYFSGSWTDFSYDISAHADGSAAVYLRWTYQEDPGGSASAGMSIDDIRLTGLQIPMPGDIDNDRTVSLADAILTLQLLTGQPVTVNINGDVNGDGQISSPEVIYIMQNL